MPCSDFVSCSGLANRANLAFPQTGLPDRFYYLLNNNPPWVRPYQLSLLCRRSSAHDAS
jgi:hypothetical protein